MYYNNIQKNIYENNNYYDAPIGIDATSYEYDVAAVDIQNLKIRKHSQMICVLHNIRYLSFSELASHSV